MLPAFYPSLQQDPGTASGTWQCCLWVPGQSLACPCPAPGLLLHFTLDLEPILAARHALVNEPCSVPSQLLGLSKQVCGMWQCRP